MKAIINGITVEGSPQEIMEYQRLKDSEATKKPFLNPHAPTTDAAWLHLFPKITNGGTKKQCSGPCYCTGACK